MAGETNIGSLTAFIKADIKGFQTGIKQATAGLKGFATNSRKFLNDNKLMIGAMVGGIGAAIATSIKAYGEEEQAIAKLTVALRNQGIVSKAYIDDLRKEASAIQNTTTYADEKVIALQAGLVSYGMVGDALKEATKATLDFASAQNIDLKAAADLVGKAFVGETGTLSRYGIILDQGIPKTEKFSAVLKLLNDRFGGQAEAQRQTTLGQLEAMKNAFGDLREVLGALLAGPTTEFLKWVADLAKKNQEAIPILREFFNEMANGKNKTVELTKAFATLGIANIMKDFKGWAKTLATLGISDIPRLHKEMFKLMGIIEDTKVETKDSGKEAKDAAEKATDANKKLAKEIKGVGEEAAKTKPKLEKLAEPSVTFLQRWKMSIDSWQDVFFNTTRRIVSEFSSGMADLIVAGGSFKDKMADIGRAVLKYFIEQVIAKMVAAFIAGMIKMAAATAIVNTALATTAGVAGVAGVTTATAGATAGFAAMAAAVGAVLLPIAAFAAAMAVISNNAKSLQNTFNGITDTVGSTLNDIGESLGLGGKTGDRPHWLGPTEAYKPSGETIVTPPITEAEMKYKPAAEGGIFKPTLGGTLTKIAEAGSAEAVIPLNSSRAKNMLGGSAPNITINITGQFLEANKAKWQRLIKDIIVPEIKRYTATTNQSPFNRVKGVAV